MREIQNFNSISLKSCLLGQKHRDTEWEYHYYELGLTIFNFIIVIIKIDQRQPNCFIIICYLLKWNTNVKDPHTNILLFYQPRIV